MLRSPFRLPEVVTGFNEYFKFSADTETILAALGYQFALGRVELPRQSVPADTRIIDLRERLTIAQETISMSSEIARREFLIAPILFEIARRLPAKLHSEYAVEVSPRLHGSFDYFLEMHNAFLVVEAKNADMTKGFTQLSAEMIALDTFADEDIPTLYGAVTVGDVWRFGTLERSAKRVTQDVNLFRVPADLDDLLAILTGILHG